MRRLLLFLFKYRAFFTFLALEVLCGILIVQNNTYQNAVFFNTSNRAVAGVISTSEQIASYFSLRQSNQQLADEIAFLRSQLEQQESLIAKIQSSPQTDTSGSIQYQFIPARVVNNSTARLKNYLTIDKGTRDSVTSGLGVIGGAGIVGKVKYAGSRFSVVTSLLHSDLLISARVKNKVNLCSVQWDGLDPRFVNLLYVPRHINLEKGDTVTSSGFNGLFPNNIIIGFIEEASITEGAFYDARVRIINDFSKLSYIHVVKNQLISAKDSVEALITPQ